MHRWTASVFALALLAGPALAAAPGKVGKYPGSEAVAERIDRHLAEAWKKAGVVPARATDDAEFVRRVYLDLAGRIPSVAEVRSFLDDRRPNKRQLLIERLLNGARFTQHMTTVFRALLLPEGNSNFQVRFQVPAFENWLRDQVQKNVPYDKMARELLTVPLGGPPGMPARPIFGGGGGPGVFYAAKEYQPAELAGAVARTFLGVNLGCAQCHNHPFASWKRDQFWSFAAFFAGIESRRQGDFVGLAGEKTNVREITVPGTEKKLAARYLDGKAPEFVAGKSSRVTLAEWMTRADNPYFARAAVNRMWAYLFGTGLIEPIDEMVGTENAPHQPAILEDLAREFVAHGYDLRWLLRTMTATKAYQLTSARSHASHDDPRHFARAFLRGMGPEQLFDSVVQATGHQEGTAPSPFAFGPSARGDFQGRFTNASDRAVEVQTSILQALTLMNGRLIASATDLRTSELLAAIVDAPFLHTAGRIESLYLATLSRKPRSSELARMTRYVEGGGSAGRSADPRVQRQRYDDALADVFWVLLNSSEFLFNH